MFVPSPYTPTGCEKPPPVGIATPVPLAVLAVTVKAPEQLLIISHERTCAGNTICAFETSAPDKTMNDLAACCGVNVVAPPVTPAMAASPYDSIGTQPTDAPLSGLVTLPSTMLNHSDAPSVERNNVPSA